MINLQRASACATATLMSALSFATIGASTAHAAEDGSTIVPMGVTDFGAGMVPPSTPHGTFGLRGSYYSATKQKDGSGNTADNDFELDVETLGLAYFYMTDMELFGAKVGFGGVLSMIKIDGSLTVSTPVGPLDIAGDDFAIGDSQIVPILLGWQAPPNVFVNAGLQVQMPTGHYDTSNAFNGGVNHWTITPFVGGTYISDSGFEVSSQASINFNTVNPDTDYTSGIEYMQEFAIGQHIDAWTLGVAGYAYQQLTDDEGTGVVDGHRSRVFAVGPAVNFFKPGMPLVSLHAYKEFGAENHAEGYSVALRLAMSF
jgi:hypothetical protein